MPIHYHPIVSCGEAATLESQILKTPEEVREALFAAGSAIGEAILGDYTELGTWPSSPRIRVLAGKGHNAGDALVAAGTLAEVLADVAVEVVWAEDPKEGMKELVQEAFSWCRERAVGLEELVWEGSFPEGGATVLIDGLLGQSFRAPLRPAYAELIEAANRSEAEMKVSVDLPSGLGDEESELVFEADFSYMTGFAKRPVVERGGHPAAGRIRMIDLGFGEAMKEERGSQFVSSGIFRDLRRLRSARADKRSEGHALLIGGSPSMPGAALMAASAMVQAGAGLTTVMTPASVAPRLAPLLPEAMWQPVPFTPEGGIDNESIRALQGLVPRLNSMLIGPGLRFDKPTQFAVCRMVRETQLPMVLDASALYQDVMAAVWGRPNHKIPVVITPHEGEYQRLLGPKGDIQDAESLLAFAEKHSAIVVVKGPVTRVCDGRTIYHLAVGGPVLARGGSGDILAGIIAARIAANPDHCLEEVLRSIAWHGAAGEELARRRGQMAVRTTDLLPMLAEVLR